MESDTNFNQLKQTIIESLKESDLKSFIKYKQTETIYPGNVDNEIILEGRFPKKDETALLEFRENLYDQIAEKVDSETATKFINDNFNVEVGFYEGQKFESLEGFDMNGGKVKITHEDGQVLMIDFWATWCGYCQEPMQENVDLISKNPHFKEKGISIIGISCDENQMTWKQHVNNKNWNLISQFVKSDIRKVVGIKGIPCILIVDKSGNVVYIGHPSQINLEEVLLNLTEGKPFKQEEKSEMKNDFWSNLDLTTKMDIVAESNFTIKEAGVMNANFCVSTKLILDSETFQLKPLQITPIFYGKVTQFEFDTLQTSATTLQDIYNFNGFDFNVKMIEFGGDEDF